MSSQSQNKTLGTKYHNQTTTSVLEAPSNVPHEQPRKQLIHTTESALSDQGIDVSAPPGVINARFVRTLMTPSGLQPVILLTDEEIPLDVQHDYIPGCRLPEQGHVWSSKFDSTSSGGNVSISESVAFSERTGYYMLPFQFYNAHVIVRLICKPALTQSQSFWVSRSSEQLDFSTNRFPNEIGFNWIPSKTNEIYVLLPWYDQDYMVPTSENPANAFGFINVRNLTDLVTTASNEAPLTVAYYFAPYNMYTYNPLPVTTSTSPSDLNSGAITIATLGSNLTQGGTFGSIEVFEPTYIFLRELAPDFNSGVVNDNVIPKIDNIDIGEASRKPSVFGCSARSAPVLFEIGTYPVSYSATVGSTLAQDALINWINTGGNAPVFLATVAEQMDSSSQVKEIPRVEPMDYLNCGILPLSIMINNNIFNIISRIANGLNLADFSTHTKTEVISQDPPLIEYILMNNSDIVFRTYAGTRKEAKRNGYQAISDFYLTSLEKVVNGVEQIFEYQYNPTSQVPAKTYGKMFDHSPREDHHDMFLRELVISSTNKYIPFNFSLDLTLVSATFPYVNTREYLRHYFKSHMPILTIRSNKSPFSNLLCRVVQGTYASYEDVMQLPGLEWDPTVTDLSLQPYWTQQTPGSTDLVIPFTLVILSGQIDTSGMQLVLFFNTSTLDYHHKIDYDLTPNPAVTTSFKEALSTLGMCQICAISPCQCRKLKSVAPATLLARTIGIISGKEQGCESETTVERVENQSIETRSPNKIDGVTMETNRVPDSAETGKTQIEKDYHFVGALSVPLTTTLKFVQIPISHNSFGKMEVSTAKKYRYWQGEPTFKITTAASSVLAGIMYVAQVPSDFDFTSNKASDAIRMYSRTQKVFWNESCELPIKWMNPSPRQIVDYTASSSVTQLGSIVLAFPTITGGTFASGDPNLKVTIHCNTSNITYSRPSYSYPDFSYPGLQANIVDN